MALEILGSRLLAPVFGSSLFVWGALIGVVLAAMSSGYAAGGWLADRRSPTVVLAVLLLSSGVWTLLLSVARPACHFHGFAMDSRSSMGPMPGCECAAGCASVWVERGSASLITFGDCRYGTPRPAYRWDDCGLDHREFSWNVGDLLLSLNLVGQYDVSGVVGSGIGWFGVLWSWWAVGLRSSFLLPIIAGLALLGWSSFHPILILPQAVHEEDSPYQQVRVRDNDLFRFLILNNTFHAVMWKVAPTYLALPYSQVMMAALPLPDDPNGV